VHASEKKMTFGGNVSDCSPGRSEDRFRRRDRFPRRAAAPRAHAADGVGQTLPRIEGGHGTLDPDPFGAADICSLALDPLLSN